jgi:hypothetical protein
LFGLYEVIYLEWGSGNMFGPYLSPRLCSRKDVSVSLISFSPDHNSHKDTNVSAHKVVPRMNDSKVSELVDIFALDGVS